MTEYNNAMAAIRILRTASDACWQEQGSAFHNPAWDLLAHALRYVEERAAATLRE